MKIAYFDCSFGISGDMTVSALLDAGAPIDELKETLKTLPINGYSIESKEIIKNHFRATCFKVIIDDAKHHHRGLSAITKIIEDSELPQPVKKSSIDTFELLAEAEASVHGTTKDKIHFHEVGAIDSIIDIVSVHWCWWKLGIEKGYVKEINLGGGAVESAHGILPIPAPATAILLKGFKVRLGTCDSELTTPTGAVLLKSLTSPTESIPPFELESIGVGAGTKDFPHHPNILRIFIGEYSENLPSQNDEIYIVETNLDDMPPELLPPAIEKLLLAGAIDAFITPILGKKGRPGYILTVMCHYEKLQKLQEIIFNHTTTFGLRYRKEPRLILERTWETLTTPWGDIRIKLGKLHGITYQASVEFEDAYRISKEKEIPLLEIYNYVSSNYKVKS
ncbi:MAG: nickel pincer cofactor biosynthesis protein LarC [Candidatus Hydrogenedentes bacterium]|nr:nickel pincer cofactor biosynthesis protein LarC [Candidatus Hydrogenedentota bacterium]